MAAVLRWLPLSLALHSAVLAATLLLPHDAALLPLFVDLTLQETIASPERPSSARTALPAPPRVAPDSRRSAARAPSAPRAAVWQPPAASTTPSPPPPRAAVAPEPPAVPMTPPAATPPPPEPTTPAAAPAPAPSVPTTAAAVPSPAPLSASTPAPNTATETVGGGAAPSGAGAAGDGRETATEATGFGGGRGSAATATGGGAGETLALGIAGEDSGGVYAGYVALLRRRVQEALTYPSAARRRGMTGTVHLDISVEPTGRIADVLVVRSSSHEMLDAAALDSVRSLRQVPFPAGVRPRPIRVRLPVVFELR